MRTLSFYAHKCSSAPQLLFHQQFYTQLYRYTHLKVTPNFYAICTTLCTSKIFINSSGTKVAHKMLMKCHQHFTSTFYTQRSLKHKKTDDLTLFYALWGSVSVKVVHKVLVKSTPGLNFINILRTAFTLVDPKSITKIQLSHKYLFTLLGSASVKAVRRTLMKLSPGDVPLISRWTIFWSWRYFNPSRICLV